MFGEDLAAFVATVPALASAKIYSRRLPQKAQYPCIVYAVTDSRRRMFHSGPAGPMNVRSLLSCVGKTPTDAEQTVTALVAALHGYQGTFGASACQSASCQRGIDDADPDTGLYFCTASANLWLK